MKLGGIYSFPVKVDGYKVVTGGVTCAACATPYVAFRADALAPIVRGYLGKRLGNKGINAANVLGHEGAHLLGANETQAHALKWGFRKIP